MPIPCSVISKAQTLGETGVLSDPGFQSVGVRTGLSLSLDAISHSIDVMGRSPAAAATPALRACPARVRRAIAPPARDSRELICAPSCSAVGANHTVQQPPAANGDAIIGLVATIESF